MGPKSSRWFFHGAFAAGVVLLLGAAAACGLAGRLFPYEAIGSVLAGHSNRAGASFFGADYYAGVIQRGKWAGLFLVASAMGLAGIWAWRSRARSNRPEGLGFQVGLAAAARGLHRLLVADRAVGLVVWVAVFLRLVYIFQPICSDEAKAYYAWTARPFFLAISDYRAPQHLLYTFLSYPVVRLLGASEWAIRLPAFAAGVGLVVLAFWAGRKWFGRAGGLFAAVFVAANPLLVHYSVNGRAYTLQIAAVVLLWMAAYGMADDARRRWPVLLVAAGVVGLVAIPTTAFALVGTYAWLGLALLWRERGDRSRQIRRCLELAGCGLLTIWLGLLAYLPAYMASDQWYSLDQDLPPGGRIPWGLFPGYLAFFTKNAVKVWTGGFRPAAAVLLWLVCGAGVLAAYRRKAFLLLAANLLGIYFVLVASGTVPYSRSILYQGIGFWLLAGAGAAGLVRLAANRLPAAHSRRIADGLALGLLALLAANVVFQNRAGFTAVAGDRAPGVRAAMRYLRENARPGDHVISLAPAAGPVYYYHLRHEMDCRLWLLPDETVPPEILQDGQEVYWIVQTEEGLSRHYVLEQCRWGAQTPAWESLVAVHSNRHAMVFRRPPGP